MSKLSLVLLVSLGLIYQVSSRCWNDGELLVEGSEPDLKMVTKERCRAECKAVSYKQCDKWTWAPKGNGKGGCGFRAYVGGSSLTRIDGIGLVTGSRWSSSEDTDFVPSKTTVSVASKAECITRCRNFPGCKSVNWFVRKYATSAPYRNNCLLYLSDNEKVLSPSILNLKPGDKAKFLSNQPAYAKLSDCGSVNTGSTNCMKANEIILPSGGSTNTLEMCKARCRGQGASKCSFAVAYNKGGSWNCGYVPSYVGYPWEKIVGSGIKSIQYYGGNFYPSNYWYPDWLPSWKKFASSRDTCMAECKKEPKCNSFNYINGKCLLNEFAGRGFPIPVSGAWSGLKRDC